MARPLCAPFPEDPVLVNRQAGETDEDFLAAVQKRAYDEVREGIDNSDATNIKRIYGHFERMSGMQLPAVLAYAESAISGYKKAGLDLADPLAESGVARVIAATEAYWSKRGQGIKQMAQNYKMKRNEGEAIAQAKAFLDQLLSFNRMATLVAKGKLSAGSGLRQFKLGKGLSERELAQSNLFDGMGTFGRIEPDNQAAQGMIENIKEEMDAFMEIKKMIEEGNLVEALELTEKVAKQISEIDDPRDIAAISSRWKSTWSSWDEVWINGLLSAPRTAVVATTGLAWVAMRPMMQLGFAKAVTESGLASALPKALDGGKIHAGMEQAAAEAGMQLAQQAQVFTDAFVLGWRAAKNEASIFQEVTPRITAKNLRANNFIFKRLPQSAELDQTINLLGSAIRLPSRFMMGLDEMGKILGLRAEVAANGIQRAINDGVKPSDQKRLQAYVEREVRLAFDVDAGNLEKRYAFNPNTPDLAGEKADLYNKLNQSTTGRDVYTRARENTFQEPNRVARAVNKGITFNPALQVVLKPFIPFVTTPLNIIKQGAYESTLLKPIVESGMVVNQMRQRGETISPIATYFALQQKLLEDPGTSARIGGQIALMTMLGGMLWGKTQDGTMTGGGPNSFKTGYDAVKAQRVWEKYNVPYSISFGETRIPIDTLGEPFATPLRTLANIGMYSGYMNRTEQDQMFGMWVGMVSGGLFDASFLQGVDNLLRMVRSGSDADFEIGRGVQNYIATQMPFGSLLAYIDRANDPYRSAYEGAGISEMFKLFDGEVGRGLFGKFRAKIPGVGGTPLLVDQIGGENIPVIPGTGDYGMNPLQQAIPFFPRSVPSDTAWEAVMEVMGSYSDAKLPVELKPTMQETQDFNKAMSEVRINGLRFEEWIMQWRNRPDVVEFVEKNGVVVRGTAIQQEFLSMKRKYREVAMNKIIGESDNLTERRLTADAMKVASDNNDVEYMETLSSRIDELRKRASRGY